MTVRTLARASRLTSTGVALAVTIVGGAVLLDATRVTARAGQRGERHRRRVGELLDRPWQSPASHHLRFNHPGPDPDGVVRDHWGAVDVDYVMSSGPVAVVSGTSTGNIAFPKGVRMSFTVYDDPRGRRFDRMGFSWGVVDGRCHRMGMAPASFTAYSSGPGYVVTAAELPAIPANAQPPADPPACSEN